MSVLQQNVKKTKASQSKIVNIHRLHWPDKGGLWLIDFYIEGHPKEWYVGKKVWVETRIIEVKKNSTSHWWKIGAHYGELIDTYQEGGTNEIVYVEEV